MAPHRHLVVDVTVTSARTNTNVHRIGARLSLPGSLALGAQHGKLEAWHAFGSKRLRCLDYPFAFEDGGRSAPMATELVDRMAILVAICRFLDMGAGDSRSLRYDNYVLLQHFVRRTTSFSALSGGCAT
jgi:hypothetical protein